jgi:mannose-6-phosphate isomerase-like protein (cupin superfamily)
MNGDPKATATSLIALLLIAGCGWKPNTKIDPPKGANSSPPDSVPVGENSEGETIHAERLALWSGSVENREAARTSLHEEELRWTSTPQDARSAWLVSDQTGFAAWGIETSLAEIPVDWHTGRQRQGEQAIYVVRGSGFAAIEGVRYDFDAGSTLGIPYGAERQLFNTGSEPVRYVSATAFPMERHLGLYRVEQLEVAGPSDALPENPVSDDGFDVQGRRIRLLWEEARYRDGSIGLRERIEAKVRGGLDLLNRSVGSSAPIRGRSARLASGLGHHSSWIRLMGDRGQMGFPNQLALITGFLVDDPGVHSGKHAHMEAVIYVVQGEGHTVVDGVEIPWRSGTSLHIQGPQTQHQHFNTGTEPAYLLRIASGVRPLVEEAVSDIFPYVWYEAHDELDGTK